MPFTFAHPAIVLPLRRLPTKHISLTGLVAGSMAPDLEYFIRMRVTGPYGHSLPGIFCFDLPIAFVAAMLFQLVIRRPFVDSLPVFLQRRFAGCDTIKPRYFFDHAFVVAGCIVIGTCSHLLWDSFTHADGFFVERIELLRHEINAAGIVVPVFKLMQHGSTLVGAAFIYYVVLRLPAMPVTQRRNGFRYWAIAILVAVVVMLLRVALADDLQVGDVIVSAIAACMIGVIVASALDRSA